MSASSLMLRTRSQSVLPITNAPLVSKESHSFRRRHRESSSCLKLVVYLSLSVALVWTGLVVTRVGRSPSAPDLNHHGHDGWHDSHGDWHAEQQHAGDGGGGHHDHVYGDHVGEEHHLDHHYDPHHQQQQHHEQPHGEADVRSTLEQHHEQQQQHVDQQHHEQQQHVEHEQHHEQQQQHEQHHEQQHEQHHAAEAVPHAADIEAAHHAEQALHAADAGAHAAAAVSLEAIVRTGPSLYDSGLSALDIHGVSVPMASLTGKVTLFVNVASYCGYTESNYKGLQSIYERYKEYGFEILAYPCNQFGKQEPGSATEIEAFAKSHFGVTFPLMAKADVNGPDAHPVFAFLKSHTPGEGHGHAAGEDVAWNFGKFLVDKLGHPVRRYGAELIYHEVEMDVYNELIRANPGGAQVAA